MPISWVTALGIYIICWWVVLFAVLPLGMHQGAQERPEDGGHWGAPVQPNLKKKFITTTWVSAILWAVLMAVIVTGVVRLPELPAA